MTTGLTGGGNPTRDQSMFGKHRSWKSAYSLLCKVKSGMAKAALLETQFLGRKPTGVRRLIEAHAEETYRCLHLRQWYSLVSSQRGGRPVKGTNGSLHHSMIQNAAKRG